MGLGSAATAGPVQAKSEGKSSQPKLALRADTEKNAPPISPVDLVSPDKPQDKSQVEERADAAIEPSEQLSVEAVCPPQESSGSDPGLETAAVPAREGVPAVELEVTSSKPHGDHEVVKATLADSPSSKMRAARGPQESLLSLETSYAVDFFSSAPPPVHHVVEPLVQFDVEDLPSRARSALPPEEQLERLKYFRTIVVRVMLVALALFVFALYVLWRRGAFS